jgi:hypothetical protein
VSELHDGNGEGVVKVLAAILLLGLAAAADEGAFSAKAVDVWDHYSKPVTVLAPDGSTAVTAEYVLGPRDKHLFLRFRGEGERTSFDLGRGIGAELLWSPDSKALAVTTSDVSRNGVFNTYVLLLDHGSIQKIDLSPLVRKEFDHPVACAYPEPPNVAAVNWSLPNHLLVAAQILDHSICDSFGIFVLYEIDVSQKTVVKRYDQIEAKRLFLSSLGDFLQHSRDVCITNPKKCEVPSNHTTAARQQP